MGLVSYGTFNILISWQMLLIVLGGHALWCRNFVSGVILLFIGVVFILPKLAIFPVYGAEVYWPVGLICVGIAILLKPIGKHKHRPKVFGNETFGGMAGFRENEFESTDGYVFSENTLSSVRQIVLDPVFKGAQVKNVLGGYGTRFKTHILGSSANVY